MKIIFTKSTVILAAKKWEKFNWQTSIGKLTWAFRSSQLIKHHKIWYACTGRVFHYVIPVLTFGTPGHVPSEESLAPRVYLRQPQNHCQHSQGATKWKTYLHTLE